VDGWGKKAELKMSTILDLRRHLTHAQPESSATAQESLEEQSTSREVKQEVDGQEGVVQVKPEPVDESDHLAAAGPPSPSPPKKKVKAEPHESEPPLSSKNEFDVLLEEDDDLFAAIDI
jgi:hypothetical protein